MAGQSNLSVDRRIFKLLLLPVHSKSGLSRGVFGILENSKKQYGIFDVNSAQIQADYALLPPRLLRLYPIGVVSGHHPEVITTQLGSEEVL